jgi:hypothetical protein
MPLSGSPQSNRSAGSFGPVVRQGDGARRKSSPVFTGVGLVVIAVLALYLVAGSRDDDRAAALLRSAAQQKVAARRPPPRAPAPVEDFDEPPPLGEVWPEPEEEQELNSQALLTEAEKALDEGENVHAIELARGALPEPRAWVVIGVAACRSNDKKLGAEATRHLGPKDRSEVDSACVF